MENFAYGQRPSDLTDRHLGLGWLAGIRHLKTTTATSSYWHTHGQIQFLYCIRGEFSYEFKNRPPVVLTAEHYIVIPTDTEHRLREAIEPAGHRIEFLIQAGSGKAKSSPFPPAVVRTLVEGLSRGICTPVPCTRELTAHFLELDGLASRATELDAVDLALARTLACLILHRCATRQHPSAPPHADARLMDEAVTWLKNHSAENIRMGRLVSYMGYSRSRLFELFKKETGLSPADWLARYRIKTACRMLRTSDAPVSEIARTCGFSSSQYFNAAFRKATGQTPSHWRG